MEELVYDEITKTWMSQKALEELKALREKLAQESKEGE